VRGALDLSLEPEFETRGATATIAQQRRQTRPGATRRGEVRVHARERFARASRRLVRARRESRRHAAHTRGGHRRRAPPSVGEHALAYLAQSVFDFQFGHV
jgi:hypothetical protein